MHHVAYNDELSRLVILQELQQAFLDRNHAPHRHQAPRRALAQFITKMEIGHGQPALRLMEKRKPAIEENILRDQGLM